MHRLLYCAPCNLVLRFKQCCAYFNLKAIMMVDVIAIPISSKLMSEGKEILKQKRTLFMVLVFSLLSSWWPIPTLLPAFLE